MGPWRDALARQWIGRRGSVVDHRAVSANDKGEERAQIVPLTKDPAHVRAWRFARALMVGAAATGSDFLVFTMVHRLLHVDPAYARAPALATGALVQFLGNRVFTFRATKGDIKRHARLFFVYEAGAYVANLLIFSRLVKWITFIPPEVVTFLGTFVVFALYSYPVRRLIVFRLLHEENSK